MDIDGKRPTFPDGVKLKTNDLLSLQTQLTSMVQALSNMFSDGVISGLTLEQEGEYISYDYEHNRWDYGKGSVRIHGGMAKAENGELLIIEEGQIPDISNDLFWDQTNIGSGRDIWIYKDDVESIKTRPDIIGTSKSVLEKNIYKVAYGNSPSKQPYFKLCTVTKLTPGYPASIQNSVTINYALKSLTHSNSLFTNSTTYTGPKLKGYEALVDRSVPGTALITPGTITNVEIADNAITTNKILNLSVTKEKINGNFKSQIFSFNVPKGGSVICANFSGGGVIFYPGTRLNVTGIVTTISEGVDRGFWVAWGGYIASNGNLIPHYGSPETNSVDLYGFSTDSGQISNSGWQLVYLPKDRLLTAKNNTGYDGRYCHLEVTIFGYYL